MKVQRLNSRALDKILKGSVKEELTCVVKFYSNGCHLCHNLQAYYQEIAEDYEDVHFFAFNVDDEPSVESRLKFNGVPTISVIKTGDGKPTVSILGEPEAPNDHTWYKDREIRNFINRNLK
jgi:thioredoxin-like negative regulator of GroEL